MNKPEKKKVLIGDGVSDEYWMRTGYSDACDDWEKYHNWKMKQLPSEEEINYILKEKYGSFPIDEDLLPLSSRGIDFLNRTLKVAKTIADRIGK